MEDAAETAADGAYPVDVCIADVTETAGLPGAPLSADFTGPVEWLAVTAELEATLSPAVADAELTTPVGAPLAEGETPEDATMIPPPDADTVLLDRGPDE